MTHIYEDEFHRRAEKWLIEEYGAENVEHEVYLPNAWRYIDFVVQTPLATFAIEAERTADKVIEGAGQSILYAGAKNGYTPLILVPDGHTEEPEVSWIRKRVPVCEAPSWV